jgi:starch phosphorylase
MKTAKDPVCGMTVQAEHALRAVIAPMFYRDRERWTDVMRQTIAFNASFFNTHRMVQQYAAHAYM